MDDRELLEKAAKAVSLHLGGETDTGFRLQIDEKPYVANWNPLTDDGDALRLAIRLRLAVLVNEGCTVVEHPDSECGVVEAFCDDPYVATRRAIVRAAAALFDQPKEPT